MAISAVAMVLATEIELNSDEYGEGHEYEMA